MNQSPKPIFEVVRKLNLEDWFRYDPLWAIYYVNGEPVSREEFSKAINELSK